MKKKQGNQEDEVTGITHLPGNPVYSAAEDIYNRGKKEILDEEMLFGNHKQKPASLSNEELDIPGAELDDANEMIGEEDEENNYYSLGGDGHTDLDENKGDL